MRILIKYTLKSMCEKKFRAFLIILAIALSGGLFLASSRLSSSIGDLYYDTVTAAYGDADIDIYPNQDSPSSYISLAGCQKLNSEIERIIPQSYAGAEYKPVGAENTEFIAIQGYNIDDYLAINELSVLEGNAMDCKGTDLILSEYGANKLGLKLGDEIKLRVNGALHEVKLVTIVGDAGIFKGENQGGYIMGMMPFDTIAKYNKTSNRADEIHINVRDGIDVDETIAKLSEIYPKYTVERTVNVEEVEGQLSTITQPFMLMTLIVVFMSVFIIYSSFKVIMLEKLPIVGTFRSVGATKWVMNGVLLLEALFYGIIGGIGACLLGIGGLYVLSDIMINGMMGAGGEVAISLNVPKSSYMSTFFMGVIMALVSTLFPVLSVSKISLKDIILNNRPHKGRKYLSGIILGIILIIGGFILAMKVEGNLAIVASVIGMFMVIIGMIKILPSFVLVLSQLLGVIFKVVFGNIGELATKNIKKNKSVLNSITLITIGISILFSISTMTRNVSDQVIDFYKDTFKCDIRGSVGELDDQKLRIIRRNENVVNTIEFYNDQVKVAEFNDMDIYPESIQTTQLTPEIQYNLEGDEQALLKELQDGRNIIVTEYLKNKYHVELGDYLTLTFKNNTRPYKVIGFMNSEWQNGQFALLPIKYVKRDAEKKNYDGVYITVKENTDVQQVCMELEEELQKITWTNFRSIEDIAKMNQESNASMMSMISLFAILAMVIGVVGVFNNLMISFIERRQSIAMLRSLGMSKFQVLKMIFIEGLGSGIIGGMGGILGGILVSYDMNYILKAMDMMMTMNIIPALFSSYFIGGMLITVIGSIIPARGSSKLNIIEAIKYE